MLGESGESNSESEGSGSDSSDEESNDENEDGEALLMTLNYKTCLIFCKLNTVLSF